MVNVVGCGWCCWDDPIDVETRPLFGLPVHDKKRTAVRRTVRFLYAAMPEHTSKGKGLWIMSRALYTPIFGVGEFVDADVFYCIVSRGTWRLVFDACRYGRGTKN